MCLWVAGERTINVELAIGQQAIDRPPDLAVSQLGGALDQLGPLLFVSQPRDLNGVLLWQGTYTVQLLTIQAQETYLHLSLRLGNAECLFGFAPTRERLGNGLAVGAVDDVGLVLDQHLAQAVEVLHELLSMDNPLLIERLEGHP